jgi:penicillin G amidase
VPTHNLICGDTEGNIALQVSGLTPDRDGLERPPARAGHGQYEWKGFREDLPREFNPERGYIATANDNTHPRTTRAARSSITHPRRRDVSRITRLHQILGSGEIFTVDDHKRIQFDAHSLAAARDIPSFRGWTSSDPDVEWARALLSEWDGYMTDESVAGAVYLRWNDAVDARARSASTPAAERRTLAEQGLRGALERLRRDWGDDRTQWRYGRIHSSALPHMFVSAFDLPTVERPGGFGTVNATGANFRRIIDLANLDRSVGTNAPGQSAQPGSPFYDNLREHLASGEYFPLPLSRTQIEARKAHTLTLVPR